MGWVDTHYFKKWLKEHLLESRQRAEKKANKDAELAVSYQMHHEIKSTRKCNIKKLSSNHHVQIKAFLSNEDPEQFAEDIQCSMCFEMYEPDSTESGSNV